MSKLTATMPFKPLGEETCSGCGKPMVIRNGESFTASTDGKVWHYGCSPRLWHVHKNGNAGDAIDFALGHIANQNAQIGFLEDWRDGRDLDRRWPGYIRWLAVQRAGAAEARTKNTPDSQGGGA